MEALARVMTFKTIPHTREVLPSGCKTVEDLFHGIVKGKYSLELLYMPCPEWKAEDESTASMVPQMSAILTMIRCRVDFNSDGDLTKEELRVFHRAKSKKRKEQAGGGTGKGHGFRTRRQSISSSLSLNPR